MSDVTQLSFSSQYLSAFQETKISEEISLSLDAPEISFSEIQIPVEKKIVFVKKKVLAPKIVVTPEVVKDIVVAANELPFRETIVLSKIEYLNIMPTNYLALYKEFAFTEETILAGTVKETKDVSDVVTTKIAANEKEVAALEAEPEFFEYPVEKEKTDVVAVSKVEKVDTKSEFIEENIVDDLKTTPEVENDLVTFDYSQPGKVVAAMTTQPAKQYQQQQAPVIAGTVNTVGNSVATNDILSFDFQKAKKAVKTSKAPSVAGVTTQNFKEKSTDKLMAPEAEKHFVAKEKVNQVEVTIQITGTNLKTVEKQNNFKIRFQDDYSEFGDMGTGEVLVRENLSQAKTTRSLVVLKPGFIPTNSDLILSNDFYDLSIPLIEEEAFNKEIETFESRGPVGAILVELDDETELAQLDVPFGKVILLDGDMKVTERDDFRYQLFMGVKSGNALLSYKRRDKSITKKIIHIHERELTFASKNFYSEFLALTYSLAYREELFEGIHSHDRPDVDDKLQFFIAKCNLRLDTILNEKQLDDVGFHNQQIISPAKTYPRGLILTTKSNLPSSKFLKLTYEQIHKKKSKDWIDFIKNQSCSTR